jgi:hypothetical protein
MAPPIHSTVSGEIEVFADGSFNHEIGLGAWAFKIPKLKLEGVGSSAGERPPHASSFWPF